MTGDPDPEDVRKYFRALRTRRWGPGERIVFEPYTREVFEESFKWIAERDIFQEGTMGDGRYDQACVSLVQVPDERATV